MSVSLLASMASRGVAVSLPLFGNIHAHQIPLFALPMACALSISCSWLAVVYSRIGRSSTYRERVPGFADVTLDGTDGAWLQSGVYLVVTLVPLLAILHLAKEFVSHDVFIFGGKKPAINGGASIDGIVNYLFKTPHQLDTLGQGYRYDSPSGNSFFPLVEPWAFACATFLAIALAIYSVVIIGRGSSKASRSRISREVRP